MARAMHAAAACHRNGKVVWAPESDSIFRAHEAFLVADRLSRGSASCEQKDDSSLADERSRRAAHSEPCTT